MKITNATKRDLKLLLGNPHDDEPEATLIVKAGLSVEDEFSSFGLIQIEEL